MTVTADLADPAYQAYMLLRNALSINLILAGADKFLNAMIDWMQYLAPAIARTVGLPPDIFLRGVGVVEIALGLWLAFVPRRAAYWVAGWLALIIVDLLAVGTHYDVALGDFALLLGTLALGRLASGVHRWHERHK
ncbi:MAG: DoxX family membrane protein [Chloroflexi bacterium]|nr:MAG: DoxX family membrane protein [Chloroflexota bacterium]